MALQSALFTSVLAENVVPNNVPLPNGGINHYTYVSAMTLWTQRVPTSESDGGESSPFDEDDSEGI